MTFKKNNLASDEAQYLDADNVKTERIYLNKDGKYTVLWKIGTKYYVEIKTYYDENFWQDEDNAYDRSEYIIEVEELKDEEVEEYFKAYESYEPAFKDELFETGLGEAFNHLTKDDLKRIITEERINHKRALKIAAVYSLETEVRICMDLVGMTPIEALAEWDLL